MVEKCYELPADLNLDLRMMVKQQTERTFTYRLTAGNILGLLRRRGAEIPLGAEVFMEVAEHEIQVDSITPVQVRWTKCEATETES